MSETSDSPKLNLNYAEMFRRLRQRSPDCLSLEELDAYLAGKLQGRKLEHMDLHLRSCSMCAAELKQLGAFLSLKEEEIPLDAEQWKRAKNTLDLQLQELFKRRLAAAQAPGLRERLAAFRSSFWLLIAQPAYVRAAAAIVLAVGIGLVFYQYAPYWRQAGQPETMVERAVEPGAKIEIVQPLGKVNRFSLIFQWQPVAEARYYRIEIYTADLDAVATSDEILTSRASLPDETVGKLQRGKSYLWKVQAFDENRKLIKDSTFQSFEISNP